jgi:pimeloyl-ACP methyl ester carboxylesterase
MATAIAMPKLGMTMAEGTVVEWRAAPGGAVTKGAVLLVIESEKAEVEIEATATGVLRHVYVEPGTTVPCGALLAAITATAAEPFDAEAFHREHHRPEAPRGGGGTGARVAGAGARAAAPGTGGSAPDASGARLDASRGASAETGSLRAGPARGRAPVVTPAARALARQLGLDAATVPGTGPGGRVTREDVEAWAARRRALVEVAAGVALEVPSEGTGTPVVLLPGFGTDVAAFARQVPMLATRHRVRGVNPRGVGLSDAPAAECYDVATSAADVAALLDEPAHVVGASLGAAVAMELALTRPERVRSLTLVTPFATANPRLLAVLDAWCALAAATDAATLARALLPWLLSPAFLADARARERTARGLAAIVARVPAPTLVRSAAGLRAWSGSRAAALGDVAVPTLVILAGDDLLTPAGDEVTAALPSAARVVVAGAGHAVTIEAPEIVNDAIMAHLGDVESR